MLSLNFFKNEYTVMLIIDPENGRLVDANPAAIMFYGLSRKELIKKNIIDLISTFPDQEVLNDLKFKHFYCYHYLEEKGMCYLEVFADPTRIDDRRLLQLIIRDVTDQNRQKVIKDERSFKELNIDHQIIDAVVDGIQMIDLNYNIVRYNKAFLRMSGRRREELLNAKCYEVFQDNNCTSNCPLGVVTLGEEMCWEIESKKYKKNGEKIFCRSTMTPLKGSSGQIIGLMENLHNMTEFKKSEDFLKKLAFYDNLSGLPNRAMFYEHLNRSLKTAMQMKSSLAVLFLDLDGFKEINDSLGHFSGDDLIKVIAKRIKNCLRGNDLVARIGGDEFIILLQDVFSREDAAEIARRINSEVRDKININGQEVKITVSIGVAVFPNDGNDIDTLVNKADLAMYWVKNHGKNAFEFYST